MRLVFDGVRLAFGDRIIFEGLTTELVSGRVTAVVGVNGSGKSTLLRLAGRLMEPDAGSIKTFDGDKEFIRSIDG